MHDCRQKREPYLSAKEMYLSVKEPHISPQKMEDSYEPRSEFVLQRVDVCCSVLQRFVGCCRVVPMSSAVMRSTITALISCASGCVAPLSWLTEVRTNTPVAGIDPCMYDIDASFVCATSLERIIALMETS